MVAVVAVAAAALVATPATSRGEETNNGVQPQTLRVIGELTDVPSYVTDPSCCPVPGHPTPMIVDPEHNLGFMAGYFPDPETGGPRQSVTMYDLQTLEFQDDAPPPPTAFIGSGGAAPTFDAVLSWGIDPVGRRIFAFSAKLLDVPSPCEGLFPTFVTTYHYDKNPDGRWQLQMGPSTRFPCGGPLTESSDAAAIYVDAGTGRTKIYATGTQRYDHWRALSLQVFGLDVRDNTGSPLLVRQFNLDLDAKTLTLDWQLDLKNYGCGRKVNFFVGRAGDSVFTSCHDTNVEHRSSPLGQQGYIVRIPLDDDDMPRTLVGPPLIVPPADADGNDGDPDPPALLPNEVMNAAVRRIPTLPGFAQPFLDPGTGRILLLTDDHVNGEAVWVLDPTAERFIGVMTPGDDPPRRRQARPDDPPQSPGGAGFNAELGRAYLYGKDGIIVASGRQDPPMAGTFHPVLGKDAAPLQQRPGDPLSRPVIAVAPKLQRLFVPVEDVGYVVLEDRTLDPPPNPDVDLDRLTTQVDEQVGVTEANTLSEAEAVGIRVGMAGGTSNLVNPNDPLCATPLLGTWENPNNGLLGLVGQLNIFLEENNERAIFGGSCLAERVLSRGNRDFSLGFTTTRGGTGTGVSAEGQGVAFSSGDSASDNDARNAGECYRGSAHASTTDASDHFSGDDPDAREPSDELFRAPDPEKENDRGGPYYRLCNEPQDGVREHDKGATPNLNQGLHGRDGRGFPAPTARCSDATNPTDSDRQQTAGSDAENDDTVDAGVFRSETRCDGSQVLGQAASAAVGLGFPGVPDLTIPPITVDHVASAVDTRRSAEEGVVTVAFGRADGVRIGPLHIGSVRSEATSRAHGRTGTADGELRRAWCDVSVNGELLVDGCADPESDDTIQTIIDSFNQAFQKLRLSVPAAAADGTPGGYQGFVEKDPAVAAADQTVNEDDSLTVPGLQAILYNDNAEGRSRVILQFAGVRTESSYGIILLPQFSTSELPAGTQLPSAPGVPTGPTGPLPVAGRSSVASLPIVVPSTPFVAGRPPRFAEQLIAAQPASSTRTPGSFTSPASSADDDDNPLGRILRNPGEAARQVFAWVRQHPGEAALLFLVFAILALPVYLALRRRSFALALIE